MSSPRTGKRKQRKSRGQSAPPVLQSHDFSARKKNSESSDQTETPDTSIVRSQPQGSNAIKQKPTSDAAPNLQANTRDNVRLDRSGSTDSDTRVSRSSNAPANEVDSQTRKRIDEIRQTYKRMNHISSGGMFFSANSSYRTSKDKSDGNNYGALEVLRTADYTENDQAFYQFYTPAESDRSVIAVVDTGILPRDVYLASRVIGAQDTVTDDTGEAYLNQISDDHGSKVASQAAYGAKEIGLLDVRVVNLGGGGNLSADEKIAAAIETAIEQGARVINASVDVHWEREVYQALISRHPEVLFLTTGGNSRKEFDRRPVDADAQTPKTNAMLVGGVTMAGGKSNVRGVGLAVDILVPSGTNNEETDFQVAIPVAMYAQKTTLQGQRKIEIAQARLRDLRDKLEGKGKYQDAAPLNSGEKININQSVRRLETDIRLTQEEIDNVRQHRLNESPETYITAESGVSFGIPIMANIAAKMRLIHPQITPTQIRDIMLNVAVSKTGELADQSISGGVIEPVTAYAAAALLKESPQMSIKEIQQLLLS